MIYAPVGRSFKVRMQKLNGEHVRASWYNLRDGLVQTIGDFSNIGERTFTPPNPGELVDWVLVLDDVSRNYPPPGTPLK